MTIELYKDRKIERFGSARLIIKGLASRGPTQQQTAKNKLNFYENEYIPRRETLSNPIPNAYSRFIKPKPESPESLAKLYISDGFTS
jgi:hypothetical protein